MESEGKGAAIYRENRAVIGWKKTNERASLVHNLKAAHEFFLSAEGVFKSFYGSGFESR